MNQASLGINTTVHSDTPDAPLVGNLALGAGAHDSASVTGKVGSFALPDVTFYFFPKGTPYERVHDRGDGAEYPDA